MPNTPNTPTGGADGYQALAPTGEAVFTAPTGSTGPGAYVATFDPPISEYATAVQRIPMFGTYIQSSSFSGSSGLPNDSLILDVYHATGGQYLETQNRISYTQTANNKIQITPETHLQSLGYTSGKYRLVYKYHRNLLGSADRYKVQVQEVSADGLEVRVAPLPLSTATDTENARFYEYFAFGFFDLPKSETLVNLYLHLDSTTAFRVYDYVRDNITIPRLPHSIIFKLVSPVPLEVVAGTELWLAQQVNDNTTETIILIPPALSSSLQIIGGPNYDILSKDRTVIETHYKNWNDITSTNSNTSQELINKLLSSSYIEGVPLNIDYQKFENHTHFGSAVEKLQNFKYKIQLIENYDSRIASLTTDLIGLVSSSVTSSVYHQLNVTDATNKKNQILGTMSGYEKYLLKESSSYVSNSYGEFYPSTWPKYNNTKPYINCSFTSSQVEDWFDGIIVSASIYDQNNDNTLYKLIPAHIHEDPNNDQYALFINMIGQYFDTIYSYVNKLKEIHNRNEGILDGFSSELIYYIGKSLGIDFENGNSIEDLWSYSLGTNVSGSYESAYNTTKEDKTKEVWKRIINSLPYLLKTKGTERGLRALINCFGIPQSVLRIREYGGAEPTFESKTDLQYERFFYTTTVGYNGNTTGQVAQLIQAPWTTLTNGVMPSSVELRVKMAKDQTKRQTIFEVPNKWKVEAFQSASGNYIGFFLSGSQGYATASVSSSIYDNTFHHIALQRETASDVSSSNQTYTLIVKKVNYLKVVSTTTASLYISGSTSSSYNAAYTSTGSLWIPGSGSFLATTSHSMNLLSGSVQELRYWTTPLQDAILDNHALTPTSFQGNLSDTHTGSTSSYYDLGFRLCLGSDNKKINLVNTASLLSQHPDQRQTSYYSSSAYYPRAGAFSGSFYNFSGSYFNPITEIHSLEWPDLGGNRSVSNKIRIDTTTNLNANLLSDGTVKLYRNIKTEQASSDNNPPDSSRLGIYLSPLNEINQDIAEQFGGFSIDDFIGNPADQSKDSYPDLVALQREYLKKYDRKYGVYNYLNIIRYYDSSLFKLIKKFVPYRANTQVGLLLESPIIYRNKLPSFNPTPSTHQYSSSLQITRLVLAGSEIQDGGKDGADANYIEAGIINVGNYKIESINPSSATTDFVGEITMQDTAVRPKEIVLNDITSQTNLGITGYGRDKHAFGSKYVFMSYMTSQSQASYYGIATYDTLYTYGTDTGGTATSELYRFTSSRYDYHEPFGPVILDNTTSQRCNAASYSSNIFNNRSLTDTSTYGSVSASALTIYTSSAALYENNWTSKYGLRVETYKVNNVLQSTPFGGNAFWGITGSLGLFFQNTMFSNSHTGSVKLPAFYYKEDEPKTHNYIYKITVVVGDNRNSGTAGKIELHFGDLDCILTGSMVPTNTDTTYTFTTQATGPWLGLRISTVGINLYDYRTFIKSLKIQPLNYRSQTQDYHLRDSKGMSNARYNGCKMTSADWNVRSRDTVDKGPVVTILVGGGNQINVSPSLQGNLTVTKRTLSDSISAQGNSDLVG